MAIEQIPGGKELMEALMTMPGKLAKGMVRRATAAAARVIRTAVRNRAPVYSGAPRKGRTPGTIKRAVYSKSARELSSPVQVGFIVGILKGRDYRLSGKKMRTDRSRDAYYAGWVEFGHKIVARGKGKKGYAALPWSKYGRGKQTLITIRRRAATGRVSAQPFMKPAFEASWRNALAEFTRKASADFASGKYA